jgi:hypothetical protein
MRASAPYFFVAAPEKIFPLGPARRAVQFCLDCGFEDFGGFEQFQLRPLAQDGGARAGFYHVIDCLPRVHPEMSI